MIPPMPRPSTFVLLLTLSLPLAACEGRALRAPAVAGGEDAPWPMLLPLSELLSEAAPDFAAAEAESRAVLARAAALKRRAVLLRRAPLSAAERRRLQRAADGADP